MGAFDLNRSHFSVVDPVILDHGVAKKPLKTKETHLFKLFKGPCFNPTVTAIEVLFGNRNRPVVMNHQLLVVCDADVKFDTVEMLDSVP